MSDFIRVQLINEWGWSETLAVLSFLISIGAMFFTIKQSNQQDSSLQLTMITEINKADDKIEEIRNELDSIKNTNAKKYKKIHQQYIDAIRCACNMYELACLLFIEKKINREIFMKFYGKEIEKMCCKDDDINSYALVLFDESGQSTYKYIFDAVVIIGDSHCD